ncbi:hypothetical protein K8942_01705 [Candidatus Peribacteria bacterium]|nr:MAG: hypothetical protein K8942_01705 [Candidatus Peribacteria bacterium]
MTKIMFTGDRSENQAIIDDITENVTGQRPHVRENLIISHAIEGNRIRIQGKLAALLERDGKYEKKNEEKDDYHFFSLSLPLDSEVDVDADIIRPLVQGIGEYDTDGR